MEKLTEFKYLGTVLSEHGSMEGGVLGWDGESTESMSERFGMSMTAKGVDCGVVRWVKCGTLR